MKKKYEIKTWRTAVERKPEFGKIFPMEQTTKIFDQLTFVGDPIVCCFILETEEGLILIDAMDPKQRYLDAIVKGVQDIGYEMSDIKVVLYTHGHGDHYGMAGEIKRLSGAKLYMSEGDYELAKIPMGPFPGIDCEMDGYLYDGQDFEFGGIKIHCVETPGHTDHCMSFIFPVTDEGRPHMASLWGGTGLNPGVNIRTYSASVDKFEKVCVEYGVDVEISNHPPVDNGCERLALIRSIANGVPNPFVIGKENLHYYMNKFRTMADIALKENPGGIMPPRPMPGEKK